MIVCRTAREAVLLENMKQFYNVIEVAIKRNHDGGCDARVRGLKLIGGRYVQINELITTIYCIHFVCI